MLGKQLLTFCSLEEVRGGGQSQGSQRGYTRAGTNHRGASGYIPTSRTNQRGASGRKPLLVADPRELDRYPPEFSQPYVVCIYPLAPPVIGARRRYIPAGSPEIGPQRGHFPAGSPVIVSQRRNIPAVSPVIGPLAGVRASPGCQHAVHRTTAQTKRWCARALARTPF
eukprot:8818686-Pyramimonas_sp.AAC.2